MPVKLVGETLAEVFTRELPIKLIGDKAYDSDSLDAELAEQAVVMTGAAQAQSPEDRDAGRSKTALLQATMES